MLKYYKPPDLLMRLSLAMNNMNVRRNNFFPNMKKMRKTTYRPLTTILLNLMDASGKNFKKNESKIKQLCDDFMESKHIKILRRQKITPKISKH